jgi:hypothetical protein
MKWTKVYSLFLLFILAGTIANAQDIVVISQGNFIRGTIKGTNFSSVVLKNEDESMVQYNAADIKEFVWNGETYVSKPIVLKKKMEHRFFKVIEQGAVNLYAIGGNTAAEQPQAPKRARIRPSIGIGTGTGGFGGVGGGISFGGGNRSSNEQPANRIMPTTYFIEKFGTGPMQAIDVEGGKAQQIKDILLQKLNNDQDLAERINATENFDTKLVRAFVAAYNSMKK